MRIFRVVRGTGHPLGPATGWVVLNLIVCELVAWLQGVIVILIVIVGLCRDEDELLNTQCPQNLELRWQTEVSSSIYATPLIADINR